MELEYPLSFIEKLDQKFDNFIRNKVERYVTYPIQRWILTGFLYILYILRIFTIGGFYVVSYILGLYVLHLLVQFLTPLGLPELSDDEEDVILTDALPIQSQQAEDNINYKPMMRSVNEFNFWKSMSFAIILALLSTLTRLFDLPVFWPFLLGYFIFLTIITIQKQIKHMNKYKYSIFDFGKKKPPVNQNDN